VYVAFIPLHGFWLEFSNSNKISKVKKKFQNPSQTFSSSLSFPAQLSSTSLSTQRAAHLPFLSPPPAHSTSPSLFFF
jgi:hypothetical protein